MYVITIGAKIRTFFFLGGGGTRPPPENVIIQETNPEIVKN
jgi:hypothetical protein